MKFFLFILIYFIFITSIFSQEVNKYEFVGALHTSSQEIISYKINFTEIGNGKIEGESFTDFYGENYTTSKIIGSINHKEKELSFTEVSNISSKSSEDAETFCFVQVKNLKIRSVKDKKIIQGSFNGKYPNNENCATGIIYLVSANLLAELNINNDSLRKLDSLMKISNKSKGIKMLKKDDKLSVTWKSKKIILDVWDGSKEDNDMINIYFNGKLIEENLVIKNQKKTIVIPFKGTKGTIRILALNEGESATNTVSFLLKNGTHLSPFISSLKMGEEITVEFNR